MPSSSIFRYAVAILLSALILISPASSATAWVTGSGEARLEAEGGIFSGIVASGSLSAMSHARAMESTQVIVGGFDIAVQGNTELTGVAITRTGKL